MSQLLEYISHHSILVSITAILAVLVLVFELRQRRSGGTAVSAIEAVRLINAGALAVDTRGRAEFEQGHLIDARHMPSTELANAAEMLKKYREKPLLVYCETGLSSAAAVRTLRSQGFTKVVNLQGGLGRWRQENLPLVKEPGPLAKETGKGKRAGK